MQLCHKLQVFFCDITRGKNTKKSQELLICEAAKQTNPPLLYYAKMLRFTALLMLVRIKSLL